MNDGWKADFDFLMRTDKATAVLEGKYNNATSPPKKQEKEESEEEKIARKTQELEEAIRNENK